MFVEECCLLDVFAAEEVSDKNLLTLFHRAKAAHAPNAATAKSAAAPSIPRQRALFAPRAIPITSESTLYIFKNRKKQFYVGFTPMLIF